MPSGPVYGAFEGLGTPTRTPTQNLSLRPEHLPSVTSCPGAQLRIPVIHWSPFRPASIALRADVASGDHDKSGPNLQTFSPLFPTGFYFNQAILKTVRSTKWVFIQTSRSTWTKALRSMANGVGSRRQSTTDGIYGLASNLIPPVGTTKDTCEGSQAQGDI